jgi:NADH/F420H2 dehydrogenase subunit C
MSSSMSELILTKSEITPFNMLINDINYSLKKLSYKGVFVITNLFSACPIIAYQNFKYYNELCLVLFSENINTILNFLKNHINYQFSLLSCLTGIDLLDSIYRFAVSYDLLSITFNSRIRLKILINENEIVPSSTETFINANWWEREVWDLFGIYFSKHPDLRRILTDYGFEGHPLRKDFPLYGYYELMYDFSQKGVLQDYAVLTQEYRLFNYESSTW